MKRSFITCMLITVAFLSCKKDKDKAPSTAFVVTTAAVTNITINSATGGGSIVSDGGAAINKSGVLWSKTNNTPTFADSVVTGTTANGTFTSNITGLDFNNTYYVRAFAINSVDTAYGSVVTFSTVNDTNKVRFTYNGQEVTYGIIISPTTGRKWLDRNLGAKQVATAKDDYLGYGDLFQWGRPADGHQLITWTSSTVGTSVNGVTTTIATSDEPGHTDFIRGSEITNSSGGWSGDWRVDNNGNRWAANSQGPCPAGWHVPTNYEWKAEVSMQYGGSATSGGMTDAITAYNQLKITVAGVRPGTGSNAGKVVAGGIYGGYWSSKDMVTLDGFTMAYDLEIGAGFQLASLEKSWGMSVRCIKDL